jgi:hypothetical protein
VDLCAPCRQELEAAQQQILELFDRVKEIQRKAEESETMVQEICKDIRKLDYAKKHLTNAITALRRMAMLTAAVAGGVVGQHGCGLQGPSLRLCLLHMTVTQPQYSAAQLSMYYQGGHTMHARCLNSTIVCCCPCPDLESISGRRDSCKKSANLLEAVHQLMEYFQQYEDVPKVGPEGPCMWGLEIHKQQTCLTGRLGALQQVERGCQLEPHTVYPMHLHSVPHAWRHRSRAWPSVWQSLSSS